ncbi:hypothetical protein WUBG_04201 [Wuchereria bancrofti]|uniref:Uncharacterized protein n=1 Tax=Wuchereria bancrofti TaxID=6293 RepID=J9BCH2_WUCBA|nr:hypothetical protein WUBG_04201 [Wuchereria bancrofti]
MAINWDFPQTRKCGKRCITDESGKQDCAQFACTALSGLNKETVRCGDLKAFCHSRATPPDGWHLLVPIGVADSHMHEANYGGMKLAIARIHHITPCTYTHTHMHDRHAHTHICAYRQARDDASKLFAGSVSHIDFCFISSAMCACGAFINYRRNSNCDFPSVFVHFVSERIKIASFLVTSSVRSVY